MPFPETWPTYIPKDKLAGWFEYYAESMELNVWQNTQFIKEDYNKEETSALGSLGLKPKPAL